MKINPKKIARKLTRNLCNSTYKKKLRRNPDAFYSLQELCTNVGVDTDCLEAEVKSLLDTTVSQVCRYGDRFTNNCVAFSFMKIPMM